MYWGRPIEPDCLKLKPRYLLAELSGFPNWGNSLGNPNPTTRCFKTFAGFDHVLNKGFPYNIYFILFPEPDMTLRCKEEYLSTPLPAEEPLGPPMAWWEQVMGGRGRWGAGGTTTRRWRTLRWKWTTEQLYCVRFVNCLCEF